MIIQVNMFILQNFGFYSATVEDSVVVLPNKNWIKLQIF